MSVVAPILLLSSGCISNIIVAHDEYCNRFSEAERSAFRTLTGNVAKIHCENDQ